MPPNLLEEDDGPVGAGAETPAAPIPLPPRVVEVQDGETEPSAEMWDLPLSRKMSQLSLREALRLPYEDCVDVEAPLGRRVAPGSKIPFWVRTYLDPLPEGFMYMATDASECSTDVGSGGDGPNVVHVRRVKDVALAIVPDPQYVARRAAAAVQAAEERRRAARAADDAPPREEDTRGDEAVIDPGRDAPPQQPTATDGTQKREGDQEQDGDK